MAARRKYPWEMWFGTPRTVLYRGVDYHLSQSIMYQTIYNNARLYRMLVRVTDCHDSFIVEVLGTRTHKGRHTRSKLS